MTLPGRPQKVSKRRTANTEKEIYTRTIKERVDQALHDVLGITSDIAHDLLALGSDLLGFAPIPGLGGVARTLLHIWDGAQKVTNNQMACLSLTEKCADTLIIIYEEITQAGAEVFSELRGPLDRLTKSFDRVQHFVDKQSLKAAFTRYFQREKVERAVRKHQNSLNDALTIQIRTLTKVIKAGNLNDETYNKLRALVEPYLPSSPPAKIPQQTSTGLLSAGEGAEHVSTPAQDDKYGSDAMHKATDLRQVMNEALQMDSDSEMVRVLQARLVQSPETMKMFQLAFQAELRNAATQSDSGNPSEEHSTYHDAANETSVSHDAMTGGVEVESLGRSASNPSTANEQAQPMQIAQQYRMLLQHGFHPSLTLPLWTPSQIPVGAVGYYTDSEGGSFVTLLNSFDPARSSRGRAKDIPPLGTYGSVSQVSRWQDRRNVIQRGLDIMWRSWWSLTWHRDNAMQYL
ncbi:hypothetical protein TRAPUB_6115 [Trametes pubescens]|uniref:Uncharacterized protein n=1 Tax=Trametes pubescens TaxID=154538 RepID=A0A1M2V714_TRAPU|nr:hypothetical protein TRAPUB_6115 [Trametes pubescens]